MTDYVDLHCHYLPGVDDGVRSFEEGVALCRALRAAGYATVTATPHIRSAMFENEKLDLERRFAEFVEACRGEADLPELLLGAEHFCDDVFWSLFEQNAILPYTGGKAALIELPQEQLPLGLDTRVFKMRVRGIQPVLAHPERYPVLFDRTAPIARVLELGALPLLDVMSLVGKYGRKPRYAAERMLEEDAYFAACSDCHRPADVEQVVLGIERLESLVGEDGAHELLSENPRAILQGEVDT